MVERSFRVRGIWGEVRIWGWERRSCDDEMTVTS